MKLSDLFTRNVVTAAPRDTLATIAGLMQKHNVGAVVILEDQRPIGIVTDRDLALALGARGMGLDTAVEKVMTRRVVAIPEDAGIFTATQFVRECKVRRLPVVDRDDRLVGMVTLDDLLRCLGREASNLVEGIEREMKVK